MKKNLAKNIKYILENFDSLDFTTEDLTKLQETLNFIKIKVQLEIIASELEGNEDLRGELLTTLDELRKRKEELEREKAQAEEYLEFKYPEFEAAKRDDEISTVLQERVEQKRRTEYETAKEKAQEEHAQTTPSIEAKIKEIESKIALLKGLEEQIETPDKFIAYFLEQESTTDLAQSKQNLINICANCMSIYDDIGEVFNGMRLFEHSSNGYIINPEAVEGFLEVARDEELIEELTEFRKIKKNTYREKGEVDKSQEKYDYISKRKRIFDENPELVAEVASSVKEMFGIVDVIQMNDTNLPVTSNPFTKFFNNILRKQKMKKVNFAYEKFAEKFEGNSERIEEDTKYNCIYNSFESAAVGSTSKFDLGYESEEDILAHKLIEHGIDFFKAVRFSIMYVGSKDKTVQELISETDKYLEALQSYFGMELQAEKEKYEQTQENEEMAFKSLSPRGQEAAKLDSYIDLERYVTLTYPVSEGKVSPYVASLMLEALLKSSDVKTVEEAEKCGLTLTEEEINKAKQTANQSIPDVMEYVKKVKEKVDGTRDDDLR